MEWKAKLFHDFDERTLDLKTIGIVAKLDQLRNHCWLDVAHLIKHKLKTLVGSQLFRRYVRFGFPSVDIRFHTYCMKHTVVYTYNVV